MNNRKINQKVFLKRVKMFFGHAVGNVTGLLIASLFVSFVMNVSGVTDMKIYIWLGLLICFMICIFSIEYMFDSTKLTVKNASIWLWLRMIFGAFASLLFGLSVFILPADVPIQHVMYIFIILITIISLTLSSYAIMLRYSLIVLSTTLIPVTVFLFTQQGDLYLILAITSLIIVATSLLKAIQTSKSATQSLNLNEELREEIYDHKLTKNKLKHMVNHDALTGLPNRYYLIQTLNKLIKKTQDNHSSLAVLYIDLDGFKTINDTTGMMLVIGF